jgi:hypothetical protein
LKTFFVTKEFENLESFIETVFPDFYHNLQLGIEMKNENLAMALYEQLGHQFRKFIVENYDNAIEDYVKKETESSDIEKMKDLIITAITITFSVKDKNNDCIDMDRYLDTIQILIDNFKNERYGSPISV